MSTGKPPQKGLEIFWGAFFPQRPKKAQLEFPEGVGGSYKNPLPWGGTDTNGTTQY